MQVDGLLIFLGYLFIKTPRFLQFDIRVGSLYYVDI